MSRSYLWPELIRKDLTQIPKFINSGFLGLLLTMTNSCFLKFGAALKDCLIKNCCDPQKLVRSCQSMAVLALCGREGDNNRAKKSCA